MGQEFHVSTIHKSFHTKKVWKLIVCTSHMSMNNRQMLIRQKRKQSSDQCLETNNLSHNSSPTVDIERILVKNKKNGQRVLLGLTNKTNTVRFNHVVVVF